MAGPTQDGVCTLDDEAPPLLPQRVPSGGPADPAGIPHQQQGADPSRRLPDADVLRQVLAGLRRLA